MKAMILAAGRGKRMMPLTADNAKPLLHVWGRPMIEWQLLGLKKAGIREFVVNTAHCSHLFPQVLGIGEHLGVSIRFSEEGTKAEDALETRGGIVKALGELDDGSDTPFILVAGDVVTDFPYERLVRRAEEMTEEDTVAHLVLVPNPDFHAGGDMALKDGQIVRDGEKLTYACLAVLKPSIFRGLPETFCSLFPWLYEYVEQGLVSGELCSSHWANIGTPQALEAFNREPMFEGLEDEA